MTTVSRRVSSKNKAFWALSKDKKRVAIAKDVIGQILSGRIFPTKSIYFETSRMLNGSAPLDLELSKVTCNCCALGAAFCSLVSLGDRVVTEDVAEGNRDTRFLDDDKFRENLREVFSPNQLSMIESAFEECIFVDKEYERGHVIPSLLGAVEFGDKYDNPTDRMVAICLNIIKYRGTFRPEVIIDLNKHQQILEDILCNLETA